MDFISLLLRQNILMFMYLLIGYFLYHRKLVTNAGSAELGRMLLYIIMPAAILRSYMTDYSPEMLEGLLISFFAALFSLLLSMIISRFFFKKEANIERFGAAFSNAGFIGIPLVQLTLGDEAVFYVSSFVALLNILQWTYGVFLLTQDKSVVSFQKLCTNPIILSFLAGLILFFIPLQLPDIMNGMIGTLADMNGPLAMIVLGTYLAQIPLRSLFTESVVYRCTFVRLIVIPVLTILMLVLLPEEYRIIKLTVLIAASAPVGSNVAIFAQLYDGDYFRAVKEVCLSTVFSIITLPLITGIASFFY